MKLSALNLWRYKSLRILYYLFLSVISLIIFIIVLLQVGFVQQQIAQQLSQTLSDESVTMKISPITGFFPFDIRFDEFSIADQDGVWLQLEQAHLSYSMKDLLKGKIQVDELSLKRIWIKKLPPSAPEKEKPFEIPNAIPEIDLKLPFVNARHIRIDEIQLEKAVIGQAMRLNFVAGVKTIDQDIKLKLALKRLDQPTLKVDFKAELHLKPLTLATTLNIDETGGLLAAFSQQPDLKDLHLSLTGKGLLKNWQAHLETQIQGVGSLKSDLKLAIKKQPQINLTTTLQLKTKLIAPEILKLIGKQQRLTIEAVAKDSQTIQLKKLKLNNHLMTLRSRATVDLSDQKIQSNTHITLNKLSKLNALAGIKLGGATDLKLAVNGRFLSPKIQLKSHFKNLVLNDLSTQTLDLSLKLKPLKSLSEGQFKIALNGALTGLKQQGKSLPEPNLSWKILANIDENKRLDLEKLQLDGQWAHINLAGFFDSAQQQGSFDLKVKLDHLKALTKDIKANVQTTANINIHPKLKQIDVGLNTDIFQLEGLVKPVPQLVGQRIQLKSQIELIPEQRLIIKQLSLNAKAINVTGKTELNLKNNQLDTQVKINIPRFKYQGVDLNRLEVVTNTQFNLDSEQLVSQFNVNLPRLSYQNIKLNHLNIAAKTKLNLKTQELDSALKINIPQFKRQDINLKDIGLVLAATGTTEKPSVTLLATVPKIIVAKQTLKAIELRVSADDVMENVYGQLGLKLKQYGQPLSIDTAYLLKQPQLILSKLSIKAPKTQINGNLAINLSNTKINGTLKARSDLTGLKPWHQQALAGQLQLDTTFKPQQGQQSIQFKTALNQFKLDQLTFENLRLKGQVDDALTTPKIKANAILNNLKQQESSVEQLKLAVSGVLEQLKIQLSVKGKHQQPFEIALAALLKQTDQQTQVELQSLTGMFMKQKIQLTDTSEITIRPQQMSVSPLSLFFGKAHLHAQVDYSAEKLVGNVQLGVPLEWVNTLAGTAFKGDFSTNIQLSGNAAAPKIDVAINLKDLALKDEVYEKIPATQIQLNAHINHENIHANLAINNPQFKAPLLTELELPIQLTLEPFNFEISKQKNLKGTFTAALQLEDLVKSFSLDDQKIAGNFNADFLLSGSYDEPNIKGRLALTKGEYQNSTTETYLKDMQLQLDGHSKQVTLTHLKIFDPNQGSILGTGVLSFDTDAHFPFKSDLKFNHIQLADSALIKTHLSGGLKIKGDIQQALLSGQLNIDDFRLTLASMSSQKEIPEIAVIEIGKNRPSEKQQYAKKQAKKSIFKMKLDVKVQIANQCFIKGYGLDSEWEGGLTIKGDATTPKITGLIKTKKGSLDLLSTRFVLSHGLIDFNGAYPPLPSLDIEAIASSDDGDAIIQIKGMADDPKLVLAHDPVKPQSEIISHLLFKTDTKTISPMQALKLAEVVTMLASGGLMNIDTMGSLQSGLGLDRLSIGGDSFNNASVKAGKYITDKIYLEVEQGIKSASSKATIEVDLYPEIKAELEFNQNSSSSVGIKWKRDY